MIMMKWIHPEGFSPEWIWMCVVRLPVCLQEKLHSWLVFLQNGENGNASDDDSNDYENEVMIKLSINVGEECTLKSYLR